MSREDGPMSIRRSLVAVLGLALLANACSGSDDAVGDATPSTRARQPVAGGREQRPRRRCPAALRARDLLERRPGREAAVLRTDVVRVLLPGRRLGVAAAGAAGDGNVRRRVRHTTERSRAGVHRPQRRPRRLSGGRRVRPRRGPGRWTPRSTCPAREPGRSPRRSSYPRSISLPAPGRTSATDGEPDDRLEGRAPGRDRLARARRRAGARPRPASDDDRRRARAASADRGDLLDASLLREPHVRTRDRRRWRHSRSAIRIVPSSSTWRSGATTRRAW